MKRKIHLIRKGNGEPINIVIESRDMGGYDLEDIIKMNMIFPFQTRFNSDENVFCCQVKTDRQAKKVIKRLEYLLEVGL